MDADSDPRATWRSGFLVLAMIPFLGMALTLADPPTWLQVPGVLVMLALVGVGSSLMRRRENGWRPSETLPRTRPVDD